ncbi:MAG: tRNA (adenosine(37)-N6)-threonylcarbamoyltransferase complex dimerization subunit type 1 TsaB [Tannerellaceae bacterium]|nr:tRNA (adenosine(37)-N6)-threonylcarbamoyltransferase complex dimerization subunit type 1 TsaB [Tannerellaceae bacterium]
MPCLLHIETSTAVCSVALSVKGEVFFEKASFDGPSHAALLGVYVEEALAVLKREALRADAVAVSSGPGSYTGLRIGVSMAKGLCFGYGIPLVGVPTLEILASKAIRQTSLPEDSLYCAMLDARRMEVYAALFNRNRELVRATMADVVTADTYAPFLARHTVCFLGNGAAKCKGVIASPRAVFADGVHPLATDMVPVAEELFHSGKFEDTAYFEPFYLKEFMATTAKNKVFTHNK